VTVEPRVEDLLASIRKAIDEDDAVRTGSSQTTVSAGSTSMNETGKLARGSLREMRVSAQPSSPRNQDAEIEGIRAKVDRSFAEAMASRTEQPKAHQSEGFVSHRETRDEFADTYAHSTRRGYQPEPVDFDNLSNTSRMRRDGFSAPDYDRNWDQRHTPPGALLSLRASQSAQASFDHLAQSIMSRMGGDRMFEDLTRELLRTMLRNWLDDNLPSLVERLVREEIERVARRGR
jgi:uncharacterized protein